MKFPPFIEENSSEIIKIGRPHEKGLVIKSFSNYLRIFLPKIQLSEVIHQKTSYTTSYMSIYGNIHAANTKTLQVHKKLAVDGST